jgi:hypothetical protein
LEKFPLITLTTDFGVQDPYVGVLKGVFHSHLPNVRIVDITHHLPPFRPDLALPFLLDSLPWFPSDAFHLVIVDPGVGSDRPGVLMRGSFGQMVLPDNGLPRLLHEWMGPLEAYLLDKNAFPAGTLSPTFQARDFFAPALIHLIQGVTLSDFSFPIAPDQLKNIRNPGQEDCLIWNIDRFGNVLLGFHVRKSPAKVEVLLEGRTIPFVTRYQECAPGELGVLVNSSRWLEIFCREGSAANQLDLQIGKRIPVRISGGEGRFL